jgi:hypothetical protein
LIDPNNSLWVDRSWVCGGFVAAIDEFASMTSIKQAIGETVLDRLVD